ncbi:hypothetical protein Y919_11180 [Caloranaerobacter azorensis H53214]|uniref:Uncharacterized protein n=1 Tax=Caloranaerobacter azorensis H53214 TaxID=1156417 RepID=A0A096BFU6_9FIRM|nr:hypothetical protein [Caloranaerobacter azorensis]KGG79578.1 hypothetical protein Y919_11180 [Caloranaerobacter azorensis H53214]
MKKRSLLIIFIMVIVYIIVTSLACFAKTEVDKEVNVSKDDILVIEVVSKKKISGSDTKLEDVKMSIRTYSQDYDTAACKTAAGFDVDYDDFWNPFDSNKIRSYGYTKIIPLSWRDPVTWDL